MFPGLIKKNYWLVENQFKAVHTVDGRLGELMAFNINDFYNTNISRVNKENDGW